jgi:hypothetical protein
MTQRLQVGSCIRCEAIGVFGPSGELPCRHCDRPQARPHSSRFADEANHLGVLNAPLTHMQAQEQALQIERNLWQLAASFLALLVAVSLVVLVVADAIPAAALLLALVFVALGLSLARII